MRRVIISVFFIFVQIVGQELPHGKPKYFEMDLESDIFKIDIEAPSPIPRGIIYSLEPIQVLDEDIYFLEFQLDEVIPFHFKLIDTPLPEGMTLYFINLNTNGWVGPYKRDYLQHHSTNVTGQLKGRKILIEFSVPTGSSPIFPVQELILNERPQNFEETVSISYVRNFL